ncbi:hypothetical protein SISSUDRAFT_1038651, partial [Sistotremastrum suecicum HHB10207 ss-3]
RIPLGSAERAILGGSEELEMMLLQKPGGKESEAPKRILWEKGSTPSPSAPHNILNNWQDQQPPFAEEDAYTLPDMVPEHQTMAETATEMHTLAPAPVKHQVPNHAQEDPYALHDLVNEDQLVEESTTEMQTLPPAPVKHQGQNNVQELTTTPQEDVVMTSEEIVAVKQEEGAKRLCQAPANVVPNPSEGMIDVDAIQSTPNNDTPTKVKDGVTKPQCSKDTRQVQALKGPKK